MASTSFPNGPTHRRGGEWGGDCPVQLQREKTPLAGWRVEGVGDRPPSLPFWLVGGAGASSPALPRGHSVLSCSGSVPALFVILLRAGVGGPHGAGGLGGGHGEWDPEQGWGRPASLRQLSSVIFSVADFSLYRRSQLVAAAGPPPSSQPVLTGNVGLSLTSPTAKVPGLSH